MTVGKHRDGELQTEPAKFSDSGQFTIYANTNATSLLMSLLSELDTEKLMVV